MIFHYHVQFTVEGCKGPRISLVHIGGLLGVEMASDSKRQLLVKDRISDLPDSLLCHILSFLPTKNSVCTSILSSRWKRLYASVPILDFHELGFPDSESFLMFVSRVLYFHNSSGIQRFKLDCCCVELFPHIDGWIRTALTRNLTELDLCIEKYGLFLEDERLVLPKSVFMCRTLVVLKLRSIMIIDIPTSWCLPCLKVLLITVSFLGNGLIEKLLSGCPALEDLAISGTVGEGYLNLNISALELKKLRINLDTENDDQVLADYNDLHVLVRAPKLEYFDLEQNALSNCVFKNLKSLVEASIGLTYHKPTEDPRYCGRVTALLAQLCNVKDLFLLAHALDDCNCDGLGGYGVKDEELLWHPPELVPKCLLSHVKTICVNSFLGKDDEFEVAKYLLKNGGVLNCMKICTGRGVLCTNEEILQQLLIFERVSKTCLRVEIS